MICTNPDLIVDRGNKENYALDQLQWFLKKWEVRLFILENLIQKFIINQLDNKNKKILSIGDNLNTDIKGANLLNFDSLINF